MNAMENKRKIPGFCAIFENHKQTFQILNMLGKILNHVRVGLCYLISTDNRDGVLYHCSNAKKTFVGTETKEKIQLHLCYII